MNDTWLMLRQTCSFRTDPMRIIQRRHVSEDSRVNMTRTVQDADNSVVYFFVDVTKMKETFVLHVEPRMPDPHCFDFQVNSLLTLGSISFSNGSRNSTDTKNHEICPIQLEKNLDAINSCSKYFCVTSNENILEIVTS